MSEPFEPFEPKTLHKNASQGNTHRVHENGDRRSCQQKQDLVPLWALVEEREDIRETHDREKIAEPRTCLRDMQFQYSEVDDVPIEIDRDTGEFKEPNSKLGGNELQHRRDFI